MPVMERAVTETTLPIYHRSIDWDALYKRYPVPDVFANTRWKWSPDQIRAFPERAIPRSDEDRMAERVL